MHSIIDTIRQFIIDWGYWAVAIGLLLENSGIPVPGETILIIASVLSFNTHELHLPWIIGVGTVAATIGDNIGYWIGRKGGRPLLERWKKFFRVRDSHIQSAEQLIGKYGSVSIFFARFVAGARIVAGPLAGVLMMEWKRFALFNFLGAITWVSVIATLGYLFGSQLDRLLDLMKDFNWIVLGLVVVLVLFFWWRRRQAARS
jgi:membrane protein DedA with SNARE-associated domain